MECCQAVRSASRGIRPSVLQGQIVRQQQRFQSSSSPSSSPSSSRPSQSNPNRSAINDLLGSSSDKSSPVSRPSILSRPRGTGLAGMLPPRPPRVESSSSTLNASAFPPRDSVWSLADQIQRDATKSAAQNGIKGSLSAFKLEDFKQKFSLDKVENIRLSPSVGRVVHVTPRTTAPAAFDRVNKLASRNGLQRMAGAQRAHERKALRRKRKLREAWRQRFKLGFKSAVNRAMELRKQGW